MGGRQFIRELAKHSQQFGLSGCHFKTSL
jgi:hypothetical protein